MKKHRNVRSSSPESIRDLEQNPLFGFVENESERRYQKKNKKKQED